MIKITYSEYERCKEEKLFISVNYLYYTYIQIYRLMPQSDYPIGALIARVRKRFQQPLLITKPATMTQSANLQLSATPRIYLNLSVPFPYRGLTHSFWKILFYGVLFQWRSQTPLFSNPVSYKNNYINTIHGLSNTMFYILYYIDQSVDSSYFALLELTCTAQIK